jgi:hypothetical protein
VVGKRRTSERPSCPTDWMLEERPRRLRNRFLLLRDVCRREVIAVERSGAARTDDGAQRGLADICDEAAGDVRGLLNALPVDTLNLERR